MPNGARAAEATVAGLRLAAGLTPDDSRVADLVSELSINDDCREMWERQAARVKTDEMKHFNHPEVGPLTFSYQSFDVRDVPGQQLVVFGGISGENERRAP